MGVEKVTKAIDLYHAPFRYNPNDQAIRDAHGEKVLDVRGWGRIQYIDNAEKLQDAVGERVAAILTRHW
jgi:hypothetical protein